MCEMVLSAIMQALSIGRDNIEVVTIKGLEGPRILPDFEVQLLAGSLRDRIAHDNERIRSPPRPQAFFAASAAPGAARG